MTRLTIENTTSKKLWFVCERGKKGGIEYVTVCQSKLRAEYEIAAPRVNHKGVFVEPLEPGVSIMFSEGV